MDSKQNFASKVVTEYHEYVTPKKAVTSVEDMQIWEKSEAHSEIMGFILAMNAAVQGKPLTYNCPVSPVTEAIVVMLDKLDVWIDDTPPIEQPQRFGNKAFRTWIEKLREPHRRPLPFRCFGVHRSLRMEAAMHSAMSRRKGMMMRLQLKHREPTGAAGVLREALPAEFHRAVPEVMVYLVESFGNQTRIDYGTGHELAFLMFLCCLFKIGAFTADDQVAVVCKVFNRYLVLVRKLQLVYRMEPAGSHGVWSLDDYQFVPFIWGSSQLVGHPRIEPKSFVQEDIVKAFARDYMFLGCIEFINKVKTGLFAEHSNQLWNISAVPSWSKINSGLIKMFKNEVLAKFPVIQHVLFGSLLSFKIARKD